MKKQNRFPENVELETAAALLEDACRPLERTRQVPLPEALGAVSAQAVFSSLELPPFDRSPLDGYALRAEDLSGACRERPSVLRVIGASYAGAPFSGAVHPGEAVRIMTGAQIPEGADSVLRQEDTDLGRGTVKAFARVSSGENICFAGEDVRQGQCLLREGERLTSAHIGLLAGAGVREVPVREPPRVALFSTGDELAEPGEPLGPGMIYDSNRWLLQARLKELGLSCCAGFPRHDSAEAIAQAIRRASEEADCVITTGGVSVGERDLLPRALELLEADVLFHRVLAKPGSPVMAALDRGKPVICLSGNPFAALVMFELIARPVLARLAGDESLAPKAGEGTLAAPFPKGSPLRRFVRATLEGGTVFLPKRAISSGSLAALVGCNCLVDIPAGSPPLSPGQRVKLFYL